MQPVAHEFLPRAALALRNLRLVMRENVVHPAAVDIQFRPQQRRRRRERGPRRPARAILLCLCATRRHAGLGQACLHLDLFK